MTDKERTGERPVLGFEVRGVEGIAEELRLEFLPGMNLLTGENGEGKTGATAAVVTAMGGDIGRPLTVNDRVDRGSVRGPGVHLNVGKRTTKAGTPSVDLAEHGRLGELIDPDGKTAATRDKKRADALLDFVEVELGEDLLLELSGGDEEIAAGVQIKGRNAPASLRELAALVKRMAEAVARDWEGRRDESSGAAKKARAEVARIGEELSGYPRPDRSPSALEKELEAVTRRAGSLTSERAVRVAREDERERLRAEVGGERPDVEALREEYLQKEREIAAAEERLRVMREQLEEVRTRGVEAAEVSKKWERLAEPVEGPEASEVEEADAAVKKIAADLEAARLYAALDEQKEAVDQATLEAKRRGEVAEQKRGIAAGVAGVLNKVLESQDLGDLRIDAEDGLCRLDKATGELEPFERLSAGERARAVFVGIGCSRYPGRLMPIDPHYWHDLQPSRQRELVRVALEEGVYLLSEHPTDHPGVHVVHLGEEWVEGAETSEAYALRILGGGGER